MRPEFRTNSFKSFGDPRRGQRHPNRQLTFPSTVSKSEPAMSGESPALSWTRFFYVFHAVCMFCLAAVQKDQRNPPGQALTHVYLFTGHYVQSREETRGHQPGCSMKLSGSEQCGCLSPPLVSSRFFFPPEFCLLGRVLNNNVPSTYVLSLSFPSFSSRLTRPYVREQRHEIQNLRERKFTQR